MFCCSAYKFGLQLVGQLYRHGNSKKNIDDEKDHAPQSFFLSGVGKINDLADSVISVVKTCFHGAGDYYYFFF
jgi:hypothetical protein